MTTEMQARTFADALASARRCLSYSSLTRMPVLLLRSTALAAIVASAVLSIAASPPAAQSANEDDVDRSIKPGDDFYQYANGGWLRTVSIPAGQTSYNTGAMVNEKTSRRVRDLIQAAAVAHAPKGSVQQK